MRDKSFTAWLMDETASSRFALIELYELRDKLLYADAPPLRQRYMNTIGIYEEEVLEAELEVSMLQRKVEMIQAAVNRRERIDQAAIERALEAEKTLKLAEIEAEDKTLNELPQLSEEEQKTMQQQYREITSLFHPAMNPFANDVQKELYSKALDAYRMQDAAEMDHIHGMLFAKADNSERGITVTAESKVVSEEEMKAEHKKIASVLATDYSLAKELYFCFATLEDDAVVLDTLNTYNEQRKALEKEIEEIKAGFPFNALSTLNDKKKTAEYLADLRIRARQCETEKAELERKIASMLEGR